MFLLLHRISTWFIHSSCSTYVPILHCAMHGSQCHNYCFGHMTDFVSEGPGIGKCKSLSGLQVSLLSHCERTYLCYQVVLLPPLFPLPYSGFCSSDKKNHTVHTALCSAYLCQGGSVATATAELYSNEVHRWLLYTHIIQAFSEPGTQYSWPCYKCSFSLAA